MASKGDLLLFQDEGQLLLWDIITSDVSESEQDYMVGTLDSVTPDSRLAHLTGLLQSKCPNGHRLKHLERAESVRLQLAIKPKLSLNIICSAVSADGRFVAFSTHAGIKLFELAYRVGPPPPPPPSLSLSFFALDTHHCCRLLSCG